SFRENALRGVPFDTCMKLAGRQKIKITPSIIWRKYLPPASGLLCHFLIGNWLQKFLIEDVEPPNLWPIWLCSRWIPKSFGCSSVVLPVGMTAGKFIRKTIPRNRRTDVAASRRAADDRPGISPTVTIMCALSQKQTFAVQQLESAKGQKRT